MMLPAPPWMIRRGLSVEEDEDMASDKGSGKYLAVNNSGRFPYSVFRIAC